MKVTFSAIGDPAAQGSKTAGINARSGKAFVMDGQTKEQRAKHKAWRSVVAEAAEQQRDLHGQFPEGPLSVTADVFFKAPANRVKKRALAGVAVLLRWKWKSPDVDKLARSLLDSLTQSGLVRDDSRVCDLHIRKFETNGRLGARITVELIDDPEHID